ASPCPWPLATTLSGVGARRAGAARNARKLRTSRAASRARAAAVRRPAVGLGGLCADRLGTGAGIGAAADRLIVVSPPFAVGQVSLDPIEAAELRPEVVSHVHQRRLTGAGHHRAPVLERAVVAEDNVQECLRDLLREPVDALDLAANAKVAQGDL